MFNYKNLCDYEFEILCKDIMQKKLGVPFQIFARGRDGGIDITDDTVSKNVVIQVKHYINSKYSDLISSLKKEVSKVAELKPEKYYVCCALELTPANKTEIFNLFAEYMEGSCNILSMSICRIRQIWILCASTINCGLNQQIYWQRSIVGIFS